MAGAAVSDWLLLIGGFCGGAACALAYWLPRFRRHIGDAYRLYREAERWNTRLMHELYKRGGSLPKRGAP